MFLPYFPYVGRATINHFAGNMRFSIIDEARITEEGDHRHLMLSRPWLYLPLSLDKIQKDVPWLAAMLLVVIFEVKQKG